MGTLTKLLLMLGLSLTVSASAGAFVSIDLVQVGGTCGRHGPHECFTTAGDTLVLAITYSMDPGDTVTLIDPTLVFDRTIVQSFNVGGSTETGLAVWSGGSVALGPVATGDIALVAPNMADGWEKTTTTAGVATTPCVYGACTSLGTASFVLTGSWNPPTGGGILVGAVGQPGGTVVLDGNSQDIASDQSKVYLGTFFIIPEPTTAILLGLGLIGLTVASRRQRSWLITRNNTK